MTGPYQRVFAREYNDSRVSTDESAVLTPGGALCTQVYLAGALLEVQGARGETMYARLSDPTGAFSLIVSPMRKGAADSLGEMTPPCFATVIGEARLAGSGDRTSCSVAVQEAREVDRSVRDAWVVRTAELTFARLVELKEALGGGDASDPVQRAIRHYRIDAARVKDLAEMVRDALKNVGATVSGPAEERDAAQRILSIVEEFGGKSGIPMDDIVKKAARWGLTAAEVRETVGILLSEDECYQPARGVIKRL
jgi:hypothetical protein